MYDFHYNLIKENFDAKLVFTDTNSLNYEIKFLMKSFWNTKISLNLVNINQKFFDSTNKNVIGKMKNEYKGMANSEFIGLKSKMYSILFYSFTLISAKTICSTKKVTRQKKWK